MLAERSLTALGAEPPMCIEILDAWRSVRNTELLYDLLFRTGTLSSVELARRKASHDAHIEQMRLIPQRMRARLQKHSSEMLEHIERRAADELERAKHIWAITLMEAVPAALRKTLALSVIVNVARHWHDEDFRRRHAQHIESSLTAIAAPLFEQSARRWRANMKPYAVFVAESWLLAPGEQPMCAARADSGGAHAALSLPVSWFTDVWARGISLVDGCFVLGLAESPRDETHLRVLALRWERQGREISRSVTAPALVTRAGDGEWRLRWV